MVWWVLQVQSTLFPIPRATRPPISMIWLIFQYSKAKVQFVYGSIHIILWHWFQFVAITLENFVRRQKRHCIIIVIFKTYYKLSFPQSMSPWNLHRTNDDQTHCRPFTKCYPFTGYYMKKDVHPVVHLVPKSTQWHGNLQMHRS